MGHISETRSWNVCARWKVESSCYAGTCIKRWITVHKLPSATALLCCLTWDVTKLSTALYSIIWCLLLKVCGFWLIDTSLLMSFSALTLLVWRQEMHPTCKKCYTISSQTFFSVKPSGDLAWPEWSPELRLVKSQPKVAVAVVLILVHLVLVAIDSGDDIILK